MPIERAEPLDELEIAEAMHIVQSGDPHVIRQIEALLDDPITVERIAVNHSSLLVRMLAQRLIVGDEKLIGVAVLQKGTVYSLPRPKRHHDLMTHMAETLDMPVPIEGVQGFITSTGRFVDRKAAKKVALHNGQLPNDTPSVILFDEDLW
jgi:hypothetical protein